VLCVLFILSTLTISVEQFKLIIGDLLPYLTIVAVAFLGIFHVFIKPKEFAPEIKEMRIGVKETQELTKRMEEKINKIDNDITEQSSKKEEKYEKTRFIAELINRGLISIREVDKSVPDKKFFTVFGCFGGFPQTLRNSLKKKSKEEQSKFTINYYEIFEKLGFIRLVWNRPYFVIAEDNVYPEKLRELENLSNYFSNKARLSLTEKWNLLMDYAEKNSPRFYRRRQGKENPLNLNMLIIKSNLRDMRHKFTKINNFNSQFNNELASITKLNRMKIREDEKVGIKNFILKSSIHILILDLGARERKKILELEPIFAKPENEGGLGIEKFYDYHKKPREKIAEILRKKFDDETKINEYVNLIVKNSKQYREDLIEMGIEV